MALVDPRLLETLRTPIQPPIDTNLRDLDSEMISILDKIGIDVSEKVRLYNQALLRYNDMTKMSATKPTPVVVVKEKETPPTTDIMGEVVTTLPKALQEKGRQLVSRLKTTQWNDCRVLGKTFISCNSYKDVARQNAVGGSLQPKTREIGTSP